MASIGLLGECASAPYRATIVDLSATCSDSWSQLKLSRPALDQSGTPSEEFAEHSACLGPPALPARASVMLYDLAAVSWPAQLQISLPVSEGGTLAGAVDVLDAGFHPLEHHGFGQFTRRGGAYTLAVFLRDAGPRYLAVSPDAAFVGHEVKTIGTLSQTTPISTGYASVIVVHGHEVKRTYPLMAGGKISVTIISSSQPAQAAAP
jgi:hypothetical protein